MRLYKLSCNEESAGKSAFSRVRTCDLEPGTLQAYPLLHVPAGGRKLTPHFVLL